MVRKEPKSVSHDVLVEGLKLTRYFKDVQEVAIPLLLLIVGWHCSLSIQKCLQVRVRLEFVFPDSFTCFKASKLLLNCNFCWLLCVRMVQ